MSMNYRTRGVKCVEVVDRYMAGLVLGKQETEDESALTLDGLTELSMAKTWIVPQEFTVEIWDSPRVYEIYDALSIDLWPWNNRLIALPPFLLSTATASVLCTVSCPFSELGLPLPSIPASCDRPSRAIPLRLRPFWKMDTVYILPCWEKSARIFFKNNCLRHADLNKRQWWHLWNGLTVCIHPQPFPTLCTRGFCAHKTGFEFYCARWVIKDRLFSNCVCSAAAKVLWPNGRGGGVNVYHPALLLQVKI